VLVVEDDASIRIHLHALVERLGGAVVGPAADLAAALRLAGDAAIDAALLDVNLGGGDVSYPVARLLRTRGIPFAFVTSYSRRAVEDAAGPCDWVNKPFKAAEIAACLRRLLPHAWPTTPGATS
jgi:CheY-like chemotaxis protein